MIKTCMFCHRPLGTNEVIEHFPVGRRLAFDADLKRSAALLSLDRATLRSSVTPRR